MICCITSLPGLSCGCALPATTTCTGSASSRSSSLKTRPARLYVAKRRAKPIVSRCGIEVRQPREARLRGGVHAPERVVVELARLVPRRLGRRRRGVDACVEEQLRQRGLEPRAEVHAVRDVPDLGVDTFERRPHLARDLAVQLRDAVRVARRAAATSASARSRLVAEGAEREQPRLVEPGACGERPDVVRDELACRTPRCPPAPACAS